MENNNYLRHNPRSKEQFICKQLKFYLDIISKKEKRKQKLTYAKKIFDIIVLYNYILFNSSDKSLNKLPILIELKLLDLTYNQNWKDASKYYEKIFKKNIEKSKYLFLIKKNN